MLTLGVIGIGINRQLTVSIRNTGSWWCRATPRRRISTLIVRWLLLLRWRGLLLLLLLLMMDGVMGWLRLRWGLGLLWPRWLRHAQHRSAIWTRHAHGRSIRRLINLLLLRLLLLLLLLLRGRGRSGLRYRRGLILISELKRIIQTPRTMHNELTGCGIPLYWGGYPVLDAIWGGYWWPGPYIGGMAALP